VQAFSTDTAEPKRPKLLSESEDPSWKKSIKLALFAIDCPTIEKPDPNLLVDRKLNVDPSAIKSTMETFLPKRAKFRILVLLPNASMSNTEMLDLR
jgi:hypothetical protein